MAMFSYITKFIRNSRRPLQSYSPPAHSKIPRTFLPLSICLIPSAPPHFLAHALQSCRTCSQFSGASPHHRHSGDSAFPMWYLHSFSPLFPKIPASVERSVVQTRMPSARTRPTYQT
ncbi:hypothetical protein BDZ91DRAFT_749001 [Kalaharituber pfeilii]|nr:hypothetical protein BDZ91DRAFT_749001 [Kalaharituber pfeilii]